MGSPEEGWPDDIRLPGPPDHLLALGAFALQYNEFEMLLYSFIRTYLPEGDIAATAFASMNNRGRVQLIRSLAAKDADEAVREGIAFAMKCFDLCAENRNLVLHAVPSRRADSPDTLTVLKGSSGEPHVLKYYDFTVADVRQAAVSTAHAFGYSVALLAWIRLRNLGQPRPALPGKPPQPRKLDSSQRRADPQGDPPPPQSSQG